MNEITVKQTKRRDERHARLGRAGLEKPLWLLSPIHASVQYANDRITVIRHSIKHDPMVEGRRHYKEPQIAELFCPKAGPRTHFRKVPQQVKRLKRGLQE
jgi:hypothetical protein